MTEFSQNLSRAAAPVASDLIRVVLIIASKLERLGWSIVVESQQDIELLGQFASISEGVACLESQAVDVVLVDEAVLTPKRCEALLRQRTRGVRFIVVARHPIVGPLENSSYAFANECILKGVSGADLLAAIRAHRPARSVH